MDTKNATKMATALGFHPEKDEAPKILATGKGYMAQKIIEVAEEHDLPIYKDERLSSQLQNLEVGESIPPELYNIVAEILVFIAGIDNRYSSR